MEGKLCVHNENGGIGIIVNSMNGDKPQYGIRWILNANCSNYPNHYYWNDQDRIRILHHGEVNVNSKPQ